MPTTTTEFQRKILRCLTDYKSRTKDQIALEIHVPADGSLTNAIGWLCNEGYICRTGLDPLTYVIQGKGQAELENVEKDESAINALVRELKRQSDAQEDIHHQLKAEEISRTKDDKKYFWLGILFSFVISMLVEHGLTLLKFLQQLLQQLIP